MSRLHKVLAASGIGSLRQMEEYIRAGRVTVNGKVVGVGASVGADDVVTVDGRKVRLDFGRRLPQVILYHKPEGEIVSRDDPEGRPTVFARLPRIVPGRWVAVGRLDVNTSGLLLFTDSGELANRLMHPSHGMARVYAVRVLGELSDESLAHLREGVTLDDGPAKVESIAPSGGEGANRWYQVVLGEGRNREVRRLFEAVGHTVSRLIRLSFGPVGLPRGLKQGHFQRLTPQEMNVLLQSVGMEYRLPAVEAQRAKDDRGNRGRVRAPKEGLRGKSGRTARPQGGKPERRRKSAV